MNTSLNHEPGTIFFLELDWDGTKAFVETHSSDDRFLSYVGICGIIQCGEYQADVSRVLAVNPLIGRCDDVTVKIAELCRDAIFDRALSDDIIIDSELDFIDRHCAGDIRAEIANEIRQDIAA